MELVKAEEPVKSDDKKEDGSDDKKEDESDDEKEDDNEEAAKDESDWVEKIDKDTGRTYYSNQKTGETQWWFDPRFVKVIIFYYLCILALTSAACTT